VDTLSHYNSTLSHKPYVGQSARPARVVRPELRRRADGEGSGHGRAGLAAHRSPAILVIPGSADPDHVEDNVAAAALRLDLDDLSALEAATG
jgi:aryl-alcohol dehydrogenase-like predicted oxidoreductase